MCGAHIMPYSWEEIYGHLRDFLDSLQGQECDIPANYNIRPTTVSAVVIMDRKGPQLTHSKWGLIPSWWKNDKLPTKTFNARSESISEQLAGKRGMWGGPFKYRRCLVMSGGYYEWTGEKSDRRPNFIHLPDNGIFAFAGMYEDSDDFGLTHTIVTAPAAPNIEHLHHRMPIALNGNRYESWLSEKTTAEEALEHLNDNRAEEFVSHEVSKQVNRGFNDASNLVPVAEAAESGFDADFPMRQSG